MLSHSVYRRICFLLTHCRASVSVVAASIAEVLLLLNYVPYVLIFELCFFFIFADIYNVFGYYKIIPLAVYTFIFADIYNLFGHQQIIPLAVYTFIFADIYNLNCYNLLSY